MSHWTIAIIITVLLMSLTWASYLKTKKPFMVDVAWALVIGINGIILGFDKPFSFYSIAVLITLSFWSLRLFLYLFWTRVYHAAEDTRYDAISNKWSRSKSWGFFWHYQFQGILTLIIACPFYWLSGSTLWLTWHSVALIFTFLAIIFEWIADNQLNTFKNSNEEGVFSKGLWSWCRHPNCFFEGCVWVGFSLCCFNPSIPSSALVFLSPLAVLWIMLGITIPITEKKSLSRRREAYRNYMDSTPCFFPKIIKKNIKK